jgi:hypothetical protein
MARDWAKANTEFVVVGGCESGTYDGKRKTSMY